MRHNSKFRLIYNLDVIKGLIRLDNVLDIPNFYSVVLTWANKLITPLRGKVYTADVFIMSFEDSNTL